jgi:hypothetical protein
MTIRAFHMIVAGLLLALPAAAWNSTGHQVIAQIAYNHLDDEVKAKCDALLQVPGLCSTSTNDTFQQASAWADLRCEAGTSTEHFVNLPISLDGSPTNGVVNNVSNVLTAVARHIQTLQNPTNDSVNQARALRYLIHFVGDIGQPLHCVSGVTSNRLTGDAGGNLFGLGTTNLHAFWDNGGGYLIDGGSITSKAVAVEAAYPYFLSLPAIPDPLTWAQEGREVARTNTYIGVTNGFIASATYSNRTQTTTVQRLALSGQRLAKLLSSILVTNAPVLQTPSFESGGLKLSWVAVPGRSYRVQTKSQLSDALWQDGVEMTATNNAASVIQPLNQPQRFYRVAVVN